MSKGKKGEMKATEIISVIGQKEKSVDFTRYTNTNTPDNGADLFINADDKFVQKLLEIATQGYSDIVCGDNADTIVRIDVKNNKKVGKDDAEKFFDDIKKHPGSQHHILLGNEFSSGAKKVLKNGQNQYPNKTIGYIDEKGREKIEQYYRALPDYLDDG